MEQYPPGVPKGRVSCALGAPVKLLILTACTKVYEKPLKLHHKKKSYALIDLFTLIVLRHSQMYRINPCLKSNVVTSQRHYAIELFVFVSYRFVALNT